MELRVEVDGGRNLSHKITVVIPSIPVRESLLKRALKSISSQTYPAYDVSIAIDHNREGAAKTRNRALYRAETEWVAFLDDDDEMLPGHLEGLVGRQLETAADVVFPWFNTEPPGNDPFPMFFGREYDPLEPHMFPIATLVRRKLAVEVGGFPIEDAVSQTCAGEDWTFWLKMRDAGAKFAHLPERTWTWHHHGLNTSGLPVW